LVMSCCMRAVTAGGELDNKNSSRNSISSTDLQSCSSGIQCKSLQKSLHYL
jgi:hypothetical protein